jgi:acyl transferase domain-containing protein/SAM-dependent methyltransferase
MTSDPLSQELSPIKRALIEIRGLKARLSAAEQAQSEPIAIIGMGLRFPGDGKDQESFWHLLHNGVDAITEIPENRWSLDEFYHPDVTIPGKMITRHGGFLKDIDLFDAAFFGISPREAESMDPQQRLLLETSWEALENGGQSPDKLLGTQTGVFIGISNSDYFRMVISDLERIDTYASTGGTLSVAAGRISYLLGLNGPAISVDTACSSSLVALHLASLSLRQKECNLALVGGVNLILTPEANINFSKAGMMALDGRCKTFDAAADGYVRGEGCGVILVKRLSDAEKDGDRILAVVLGSAVNQDGRSSGLTAPNGLAQEAVLRSALDAAGVEPGQVGYIEAHGTATSLGDPIEVHALGKVFGPGRDRSLPLHIGSVKTNIGHLEAAAGIAGVIKVILALQNKEIPPSLHFRKPNPHISWEDFPVSVVAERMAWNPIDDRLIAGVSSFGFSGTNAHVIIEAAPDPNPSLMPGSANSELDTVSDRPQFLTISAKSEAALVNLAGRYIDFLANQTIDASGLSKITRVTGVGRSHYAYRLAVAAPDIEQLRREIIAFKEKRESYHWWKGFRAGSDQPPVVFLFTGHGSHYVNMGRQLYQTEPVFRQVMDQCDGFLRPHLDRPLLSVLYPSNDAQAGISSLDDMTFGQPAMFAIEFALASVWRSWGLEPAAVAGHSLGEYVAAAIAGVLSFEDALTLIAQRGRLMQELPEDGEMVTVFAEEERVAPIVGPFTADVSIAAVNSPETLVISGRRASVLEILDIFKAHKIRARRLNISRAAHSPMVESMIPAIARTSAGIDFSLPQIEFFSSVTGKLVSDELTRPEYWQRHLRQTVRFAAVARLLYDAGYRTFLEIGPNPTLISLGQRSVPEDEPTTWLPSLREGRTDWDQMLDSLAQLYVRGVDLDWNAFHGKKTQPAQPLPTYPWDRKSYWWKIERSTGKIGQFAATPTAPTWDVVLAAGKRQSQQAPIDLDVKTFSTKWEILNQLASKYIVNALWNLGVFREPDERQSSDTLLEKYGVLPTYKSLMARWLKLLVEYGWLKIFDGVSYTNDHAFHPQSVDDLLASARVVLEDTPYVVDYLVDCGERLAPVITGKESPLELLFPGGSMQRAEDLYQNWAHARYYGQIVGAVVESVVHTDPRKNLRLLEIGAGTGATTSAVLPFLSPARSTYYFTDISVLFLDHARQKFSAYPFMQYGLFDVEKDGLEQGFGRGQFDVVIAANVVHATRSLSETLKNIRSLLAPDGVLVLFEATQHQHWYDVTTGLIEGWQSFGDDLRQDSPLLSSNQWLEILRVEEFMDVALFPPSGSPAEILGESVIVAHVRPEAELPAAESIDVLFEIGSEDAILQTQDTPEDHLLDKLTEVLPDERKEILIDFIRGHVIKVLHLDPSTQPERKARLMDLGVDSLMAVELRGRLATGLKLSHKLPATLIFDYPTIDAISDYLLREVLVFDESGINTAQAEPETPETQTTLQSHTAAEMESLSDDEVEAMLLEKLKKIK